MEKLMRDYAALEQAMDIDEVFVDLDVEDICFAIEAAKKTLDQLIFSEIGYGGQELVDFYRSKFC